VRRTNPERLERAALELAPIRVNLIAAGFVDPPSRHRSSATTATGGATYDIDGGRQLVS
jgi:hypothetical protein